MPARRPPPAFQPAMMTSAVLLSGVLIHQRVGAQVIPHLRVDSAHDLPQSTLMNVPTGRASYVVHGT
jgi:hypothetical protein